MESARQPQPGSTAIRKQPVFIDEYQKTFGALQQKHYGVEIESSIIAGATALLIWSTAAAAKGNYIQLNFP